MDNLEIAQSSLLANSDIDMSVLSQALKTLSANKIDFGDIYFEKTESESFSLEDGIVKTGSFDISKGVGVRAILGTKTGFAYSDILDKFSLIEACKAARTISSGHNCNTVNISQNYIKSAPLYSPDNPIMSLSRDEKVAILEKIDKSVRSKDPRVLQVMAALSCSHKVSMTMTTDGQITCDIKPIVQIIINLVMAQVNRREMGFVASGGAIMLPELLANDKIEQLASEAVRIGSVNLEAENAPAGTMPVVLGAGWPGVLIHEAVGHGLEGDFNRTGTSNFTGKIGQQVASKSCTIIDDGTLKNRRGSLTFDDEGTKSARNVLIENGILKGYMQDKQNAALMGMSPTGNGRRESYNCLPMPRMTNTYMLPGKYDKDEIISSVDKGIYAVNFSGGQVDITSGKFVFSTSEAYLIEHGKITTPIKGATLIGNGPETMKQVSLVGSDLKFDDGIGTCGKAGQSVPVGIGQPTLKIDTITVGGTKA